MDPVSQGVLGAALPQSVARPKKLKAFTLLGCLAGLSPDLDVVIQSSTDPLLFLEYHRQFTHSLIFIPIGALLCALAFHPFVKRSLAFREVWLACLLGYGTHALLDACTTYGTQLFWPFSAARIAWNNISIIDPLLTLPLLALVLAGFRTRRPVYARVAMGWAIVYLILGVVQRERAESAGWELARERGHEPVRLEAKAGFANILLWKVIYEAGHRFHVDAVRAGLTTRIYPGDSIARLDVEEQFRWLDPESQQARDIERFAWFSDDYLAVHPRNPLYIMDLRYSMLPDEIEPLWGILLDRTAEADQHVDYITTREGAPDRASNLMEMLLDR